jgi:hypothetical protein
VNEQLSVGDSQISPGPVDSFTPLKQGADSFGEGKDQLPKYFNILNEEGIEKKTYYQDDQSNLAEARDLLKELDRDVSSPDRRPDRGSSRVLDTILMTNKQSDYEMDSIP